MRKYTYAEIKQSRILSEKKTPKFGLVIMFTTLLLIVAVFFAAANITKPSIVKIEGVVTGDNTTIITNYVTGSISNVCVSNGDKVEAGDLLFEIDSTELNFQVTQLETTKEYVEMKLDTTLLLINFIENYDLTLSSSMQNPFLETDLNQAKEFNYAKQFIDFIDSQSLTQSEVNIQKTIYVVTHYQTYDEYTLELIEIDSKLDMISDTLETYHVRALSDGEVILNDNVTVGSMVQAGAVLGEVVYSNEADLYIEALVSIEDKNNLKVDDSVEVILSGLDSIKFGTVKATIKEIKEDKIVIDGIVYHYVIVQPITSLMDSAGNKIEIVAGMKASCEIIYESQTWLEWILNKVGVEINE